MGRAKKPKQPLEHFLDPLTYYNHGDNPALKKMLQIGMENSKDKSVIDHRTFFINKGARFFMARNWEDVLQRDFKVYTFPRAFAIFTLNTMALITVSVWSRKLLPLGRFGIRKITQTPFYHNFGPLGVVGVGAMFGTVAALEFKTFKFTLHKFYRHIIMQDRNWLFQGQKLSPYGSYKFSDDNLVSTNKFSKSPAAYFLHSKSSEQKPTGVEIYSKVQK